MIYDGRLSGHDADTESRIFRRYAEIRQTKTYVCNICRKENPKISTLNQERPVSFFTVGHDMKKLDKRLMFIGKTVTSNWGPPTDPIDVQSGFIDARHNSENDLFLKQVIPFFKCIAAVGKLVWKNDDLELKEIWKRIAVTDFVKCSISESRDETTSSMKNNCLEAGFLKAELEEIQPTHLIFFTGHSYDSQIRSLFNLKHDLVDEGIDGINIWWIQRLEQNENDLEVLRTYHPGWFLFNPDKWKLFYQKISSWINGY